jgi:hypothetical protein
VDDRGGQRGECGFGDMHLIFSNREIWQVGASRHDLTVDEPE